MSAIQKGANKFFGDNYPVRSATIILTQGAFETVTEISRERPLVSLCASSLICARLAVGFKSGPQIGAMHANSV